ncbi:MAG: hypothetical protein IJN56_01665 [Clostridia bacterium]|nr:hypothetical protein [Clostridia bacterium]
MDAIFLTVLNISITATYLILAVLLLRLILKWAPRWINCLLWGLVALRLIMPFSIESEISLVPSSQTITTTQSENSHYEINTGIDAFDNTINQIIIQNPNNTTPPVTNDQVTNNNVSNAPATPQQNNEKTSLFDILFIVWVVGIASMLIFSAVSYIRIYKNVRASIIYRDNIYYCDTIDSPFILGIIRPKIYVPSNLNGDELNFVIEHEKAHLKRRDHLWKPFGFLLLSIYWFNPFIWLSYILLCRDIESACDEKVIKNMSNEDKKGYSTALLNCSVHRRMISACPVAFGEVGVKERIKSVLNYKKPAFWVIAVAIVTSIAVAVCFLTNPKEKVKLSFLPLEFTASRNGAQHESITINPDGTFTGKYTDWDAESGEGYAGLYHICEFNGKFKDIKENDKHSYSLTVEKFESKYKDKEEWIEDETKYIATDSLEDFAEGEKLLLYKPETPISSIDQSALIDYPYNKNGKTLSCYILYTSKTNRSLFSKEILNENESQIISDYNNLMNSFYNQNPDFYYAIKDIDGNGIKELIIMSNTTITVYTNENGVKQLDSYDFVTGTVRMFSSENPKYPGIFYFTVGGGCDHYSYMTLNNGYLNQTKLCEYYYSADEPYWVDVSDDKEIIAEAKALYNENRDIEFVKFEPTSSDKNSVTFVNGATEYTAMVLFGKNSSAGIIVIHNAKTFEDVQTIELSRSEEVTTTDKNIYALDVNFDGYLDLLIPDMHPARAIFFNAYIYDSAQQKFVEAPSFKNIPNFALDTQNKQILYYSGGDSMFKYGMACYDKDKKDFVTTNSILIEPNYTGGTTEFAEYHFKERRYQDGKEIIVNEFNIPLHEFHLYPVAYPDILPYYQQGSFWDLYSDKWDCVFKLKNGKVYLPDTRDTHPVNLSLDEVKEVFEPLIQKGESVHESINNDLADIEMKDKIAFTLENGGYEYNYQLITDENFKTLDDVWQFAYSAYTHEAAYRLFTDHLEQSGSPRFLERDGKLYYYKGGHGYSTDFDFDSLQIVTQFDNTVILSIDNYFGFGFEEADPPEKSIFIMQNTENGWRLANSVEESVSKINLDNYIAYLPNRTEQCTDAINAYYDFLNGKTRARNIGFDGLSFSRNKEYISISDLYNLISEPGINKYSFYDINLDGTPELLTTGSCYDIFSFKDGEVLWLYSSPTAFFEGSAFLMCDNSLIWYRDSTGITYEHVTIDKDLNVTIVDFFDGEDASEDPKNALYMFEDEEISKAEFKKRTKNLLLYANHNGEAIVLWTDANSNTTIANEYFEKILNNEQDFYLTYDKTNIFLSDYNKKARKYSYVDMDSDNVDELAIELEDGNVLILRIDGESVIGFEFGHRAMSTIFTDGSFLWNQNSGNTYGCSRLEFTGKTYKTIELWRVENNESGSTTYYINGKTATKEEFDSLSVPTSIKWYSLPATL